MEQSKTILESEQNSVFKLGSARLARPESQINGVRGHFASLAVATISSTNLKSEEAAQNPAPEIHTTALTSFMEAAL